jgi:phage gpG-like protein
MKTLSDKLRLSQREIKKGIPTLMRQMTNEAETFFKDDVFNNVGNDVQPKGVNGGRWKNRKNPFKKGKLNDKPILTDTNRLRHSIKGRSRGNVGIIQTDVEYARFHNEGIGRMPMRKFMGNSNKLNKKFEKRILRFLRRKLEG